MSGWNADGLQLFACTVLVMRSQRASALCLQLSVLSCHPVCCTADRAGIQPLQMLIVGICLQLWHNQLQVLEVTAASLLSIVCQLSIASQAGSAKQQCLPGAGQTKILNQRYSKHFRSLRMSAPCVEGQSSKLKPKVISSHIPPCGSAAIATFDELAHESSWSAAFRQAGHVLVSQSITLCGASRVLELHKQHMGHETKCALPNALQSGH